MAIHISRNASVFDSGAQALVNPVNCLGIMGKGLALAFKARYPKNFREYARACCLGQLQPGGILVCDLGLVPEGSPRWIVNLATKDHWRNPSQLDWIRSGALELSRWAAENDVRSIACPALGAGLGGLAWQDVLSAIEPAFEPFPVNLILYAPHELQPA